MNKHIKKYDRELIKKRDIHYNIMILNLAYIIENNNL